MLNQAGDRSATNISSRVGAFHMDRRPHILDRLWSDENAGSLAVLRIGFGACVLFYLLELLNGSVVDFVFSSPSIHFKYPGFGWVPNLTGVGTHVVIGVAALAAAFVCLGLMYRVAAPTLAIAYTWLFLNDQTYYLNHYYLIVVLSWLFVVLPANRAFCVKLFGAQDEQCGSVPRWAILVARFQVAVPYVFGGIAKMQLDWLSGAPLRIGFSNRGWFESLSQFIDSELIVGFFTYGGLLFDLFIVPCLLWKPTRKFAFSVAVGFHVANHFLFTIDIFPWLMIVLTTVFFDPDWPIEFFATVRRRFFSSGESGECFAAKEAQSFRCAGDTSNRLSEQGVLPLSRWAGLVLFGIFALIQLGLPLRCFFYSSDPSWVERGHKFSWHMMLRHKQGLLAIYSKHPSGKIQKIPLSDYISIRQYDKAKLNPYLVMDLSRHIHAHLNGSDETRIDVHAICVASLNGRFPELLINPKVPLNRVDLENGDSSWILDYSNEITGGIFSCELDEWLDKMNTDPVSLISTH